MAEIEISTLSRKCLSGHIPSRAVSAGEVLAWETERNIRKATAGWRYTTADARIKLKKNATLSSIATRMIKICNPSIHDLQTSAVVQLGLQKLRRAIDRLAG